MASILYALGAISLWATLASLGIQLSHVPPFLLTSAALFVGSALAWPFLLRDVSLWKVPARVVVLGVYGLFGFHFLLFIALRHAPAVEANLVNYLWPLLIVVLAPAFLPGMRLRAVHVIAALAGFAGAALAIFGARAGATSGPAVIWAWGYIPALGSAFIWATYSLMTKRLSSNVGFPTAAIGLFGLISAALSLVCHLLLEPRVALSGKDWLLLVAMGLGPLGAAFYLWDKALKLGDARQIGVLSYITPLASTALLMLVSGRAFTWSIALGAALIIGAALVASGAGYASIASASRAVKRFAASPGKL